MAKLNPKKVVPAKPKPAKAKKVQAMVKKAAAIPPELTPAFKAKAEALDKKITGIISRMEKDVLSLGEVFREIKDKSYHVALGYPNFTDYLEARFPQKGMSKTTVFEAMRVVRELTQGDIPAVSKEDIREMPAANAHGLARLKARGTKITPALIEKAKDMGTEEFQEKIVIPQIPPKPNSATATAPVVFVNLRMVLTGETMADWKRVGEIVMKVGPEKSDDDASFEDRVLKGLIAEFRATHEAEYEELIQAEEAHALHNARVHSAAEPPVNVTPEASTVDDDAAGSEGAGSVSAEEEERLAEADEIDETPVHELTVELDEEAGAVLADEIAS